MKKRKRTNRIVIHCTATPPNTSIATIEAYWRLNLGWKDPGYYVAIKPNGAIHEFTTPDTITNGARGWNSSSVHIAYIGGVDRRGRAKDTLTPQQSNTLYALILRLRTIFGDIPVVGHRDLSPDLNGDGEITPDEWIKMCPCFDVEEWLNKNNL